MYGMITKQPLSSFIFCRRLSSQTFKSTLTNDLRKKIEEYWFEECQRNNCFILNDDSKTKFYALSMFPYPSGSLHMGHVRVYTISDVIARFHRFNGKNVFQPIGWDAFGLPAENAAIEHGIPPNEWTCKNISHMKAQLKQLRCTFDWQAELTTCSPEYYKWTQYLFLKMHDAGLVYQKESLVNWDPIDCTVLAEEQVDGEGRSWRSGAIVEKKILKQWYIRTTKFSQALHDGLNAQTLLDWDDIIDVQKNWIGVCDGYSFDLKIKEGDRVSDTNCLNIWVDDPISILEAAFIAVRPNSLVDTIANHARDLHGKLSIEALNPFTNRCLPIYVSEDVPYPFARDVYVGLPSKSEFDREFANRCGIKFEIDKTNYTKNEICEMARRWCIGGYPVSSKIQDWLVSRQRYWGTPIPMIHCGNCGAQPVPYDELPVTLPSLPEDFNVGKALNDFLKVSDWKNTTCPKCGGEALRETDTMDTFVDSSWYYLRYTDISNKNEPFNKDVARKFLPVDLYVGGKEHAVLHLYYARFFSHFLHSIGLVEHREPFHRLLCQGMVKGRTFKTKAGKYLKPNEILIEGEIAKLKETDEVLDAVYEKMSKSKYNGVDPKDVLKEYGVDVTRLLLLFGVNPKSHRDWNEQSFRDVLRWQSRLWCTITEFIAARENPPDKLPPKFDITKDNDTLRKARNHSVNKATYHYQVTQQLASSISFQQGLTSAMRSTSRAAKAYCVEFEKALAISIIMLAPIAPHFAATLWFGFTSAPRRLGVNDDAIRWDENVLKQKWPRVDADFEVPLYCKLNDRHKYFATVPSGKLPTMKPEEALEFARREPIIEKIYNRTDILNLEFRHLENFHGELFITGKLKNSEMKKGSSEKIVQEINQ